MGAVAVVTVGALSQHQALGAIDGDTLIVLFDDDGRLRAVRRRRASTPAPAGSSRSDGVRRSCWAGVVIAAGGLSTVFANDVVVFADDAGAVRRPRRQGRDIRPFLIALATASNAGSAATQTRQPAEHPDRTQRRAGLPGVRGGVRAAGAFSASDRVR
ncbi:MAG: hypothetical protein U5L06_12555 [Rhodovibrio sp.]|nr:hypothetical protein [Rhodovibrio sp.]